MPLQLEAAGVMQIAGIAERVPRSSVLRALHKSQDYSRRHEVLDESLSPR
jgi:hypothetical protein